MATNEAHVLEAYWYNVAFALGASILAAAGGGTDSPKVMTATATARTKIRRIRGASLERRPRIACVVPSYPGSTDMANSSADNHEVAIHGAPRIRGRGNNSRF